METQSAEKWEISDPLEKERLIFIRRYLRRASLYWPHRAAALSRQRIGPGKYLCQNCKKVYYRAEVHLDHVIPVVPISGPTIYDFVTRLFCGVDGFQVLCEGCHAAKTLQETKERTSFKRGRKRHLRGD